MTCSARGMELLNVVEFVKNDASADPEGPSACSYKNCQAPILEPTNQDTYICSRLENGRKPKSCDSIQK